MSLSVCKRVAVDLLSFLSLLHLDLKNKQRAFELGLCIITYEKDLGALSLD